MASKALFLVALIASAIAAAVAVNVPFGGASSTASYEVDIINGTAKGPPPIPTDVAYTSVDSNYGLAGFCSGSLAISSSDYPEGGCGTASCTKVPFVTLPQILGSASFGVYGGSSSLQLTAAQIWGIYNGSIRSWSSVPGSGLTGTIFPIARCDGSGTTCLVTSWLANSKTNIPPSEVSPNPWKPSSFVTCGTGTGGVITACRKTGAICYASTGSIAGSGINEVAVQNYGTKAFSKGAGAKLANSVPATLPACKASWASVNLLNVNKAGAYAIATFEYITARQSYSGSIYSSTKVKFFLNWTQSTTAQNDGISRGFQPLPSSVISQNVACIKAIS